LKLFVARYAVRNDRGRAKTGPFANA
jgi:hypothetical protein